MRRFTTTVSAVALSLVLGGGAALAADYGTAEEAKKMLDETVEAMKSDKKGTIEKINAGEMKDRDLYPYCGGPDGKMVAHPSEKVRAMNLKELKDKSGKAFGQDLYDEAEQGEVNEVSYMWPRPDEQEPVQKVAYVTKVDDMVCAVGYYK
ncbi:MAG: cache domain-containing protein [Rhodospirillales bacterium]|nr:cache domain-containing protein [Rhodospirillales bacterium]